MPDAINKYAQAVYDAWPVIVNLPQIMVPLLLAEAAAVWFIAWLFLRNQIANARSATTSAKEATEAAEKRTIVWKEKYETERDLHKALKDDVAEKDKETPTQVEARAIAKAPAAYRQFVERLAAGGQIDSPVNPSMPPETWPIYATLHLHPDQLRQIAITSNTISSGLSVTSSVNVNTYSTRGTAAAVEVQEISEELTRRLNERDKK